MPYYHITISMAAKKRKRRSVKRKRTQGGILPLLPLLGPMLGPGGALAVNLIKKIAGGHRRSTTRKRRKRRK